ncbi:glycine/betaine ABC transporter permease [Kineosporia sp. NBRC 101677]|uniref:ABC transporter permease n=1 Tax=Kineosporia sp. NBRC 101677 TaxID=3032197 RepID=UPI0024A28EEB|nr:ABC transporter permease [Kineosporia sp. NBRC 101677]GLY14234.1 glycine/betaine ABC transporter permease [Kineosporia sp. NBRC 101677]
MINYLKNNPDNITQWFFAHLWLSVLPVALGLLIALPIGWVASRYRWTYPPITNLAGLLYTIPSLALFIIMPSILGTKILSPINMVVALTVYSVALLVRVVADGLNSVAPDVRAAATAMGFTGLGRFLRVDLPIAVPVITAGLRVATVANVSLVSIGALIGVPQLGSLFTTGFGRYIPGIVLLGVLLCLVLALVLDGLIILGSRLLTPWQRAVAKR